VANTAERAVYTPVVCLGFYTSARVPSRAGRHQRAGARQKMAGMALGLTTLQTYRYVLLPMPIASYCRRSPPNSQ